MNRIRELRKVNKMTQEELAKKLHLKRSVISKYENGVIPLTDGLIIELANIFNVTTDYILGYINYMEQSKSDENNSFHGHSKTNDIMEIADKYASLPDNAQKNLIRRALSLPELSEDKCLDNKNVATGVKNVG